MRVFVFVVLPLSVFLFMVYPSFAGVEDAISFWQADPLFTSISFDGQEVEGEILAFVSHHDAEGNAVFERKFGLLIRSASIPEILRIHLRENRIEAYDITRLNPLKAGLWRLSEPALFAEAVSITRNKVKGPSPEKQQTTFTFNWQNHSITLYKQMKSVEISLSKEKNGNATGGVK